MVGLSLVFVFCLPRLTTLPARNQAKIKLPTTTVHKIVKRGKKFLAIFMSTTPQIRKDCCYMINVLGCVVIGICRSEGVQLKNKQANSNKPTLQTFACHLVSPQKGGSPAIPTPREGHRSCSFPICLPYSDLLISSVLNLCLHLKSLGRQLLKQ